MTEKHPLIDPLVKENPLSVSVLGICAALAITNSLTSSLIMSAALTAVLVLSDWQLAKTTPTYNSDICATRIGVLADKVRELTKIQREHHPVNECRVYLLGDLVEGEMIFPGQAHRIDASLFRQVMLASASIPGVFPPVMIDVEVEGLKHQELHVDGAATAQVPLPQRPGIDIIPGHQPAENQSLRHPQPADCT